MSNEPINPGTGPIASRENVEAMRSTVDAVERILPSDHHVVAGGVSDEGKGYTVLQHRGPKYPFFREIAPDDFTGGAEQPSPEADDEPSP